MLKARLSNGAVVLGLSSENLKRLKNGDPIRIEDPTLFDMPVFIVTGKTEKKIASYINNNTEIFSDPG